MLIDVEILHMLQMAGIVSVEVFTTSAPLDIEPCTCDTLTHQDSGHAVVLHKGDCTAPGVKFPIKCELCDKQIESKDDYEWHGLGNCVNLCPTCLGSGQEPEDYKKQVDEQTQAIEKAKWSAQLFVLEKLAKVYCRSCLTGELRIQRPDLGSLYFHDKTRCNASEIWESYDAIKERGSAL